MLLLDLNADSEVDLTGIEYLISIINNDWITGSKWLTMILTENIQISHLVLAKPDSGKKT